MPRKPSRPPVVCEFFTWRLLLRDGVYYADGRSRRDNLGKHSLATRNLDEALANLRKLDQLVATQRGLATAQPATADTAPAVAGGWQLYLDHCRRPDVLGGVSPSTVKRYRAVMDKHTDFCAKEGVRTWADVTKTSAEHDSRWLAREGYADRSIFLEVTLIKSVIRWLVDAGRLPAHCLLRLPLRKPQGSDTYCYTPDEVTAIREHCLSQPMLQWLVPVIVALVTTGLRIAELASLRWRDLDLSSNTLRLTDDRAGGRRRRLGPVRTTKGRRDRTLPIHPDLLEVVAGLPRHADGRVFHGPRGGVLKPDTVRVAFVSGVIEPLAGRFPTPAGEVGFSHGRIHSFRHYFCSQAFLGGASEADIRDWLGHRESRMVAHYRHLRDEDSQRKMRQIDFLGRAGRAVRPAD